MLYTIYVHLIVKHARFYPNPDLSNFACGQSSGNGHYWHAAPGKCIY